MRRSAMAFLRTLWAGWVRGPWGVDLSATCKGDGMQASSDGIGGSGASCIGCRCEAFEAERCLLRMDLGVVSKYSSLPFGGGKIGAPGKSTLLGMRAMIALAFADVKVS